MKQTTVPMKPDSRVNVKTSDDLSVEGVSDHILTAIVEQGDSLKMREDNNITQVKADSDLRLILPDVLTVTIEKTGGDAQVKNLKSRVIVGKISGDLVMQELGGASIETVSGDLTIRNIRGTIEIARLAGSFSGKGVQDTVAGSVGGDVNLREVEGLVRINCAGDVVLSSIIDDPAQMTIKASGDIKVFLSKKVNAQLELHSGEEEIILHAGGQDVEWEKSTLSIPLGNGGETIQLDASGSISILENDVVENESSFNDVIRDMEDEWSNFGIELEKRIREGFHLTSDAIEKATHSAEEAGEKARLHLEKALRHMDEKSYGPGRKRKVVGFSIDDPQPVKEKKTGPSDEERMLVLRMLQEKKISVEEAEKLLNALDR